MRFRIHKKGYKQLGKVSKGLVNERSTHEKKGKWDQVQTASAGRW